jgi:tetratricopeptide (TPR) repeat protein
MNETETQRFEEAYRMFEAGNCLEALRDLRALLEMVDDPWDKAEVIYHETLWLVDLNEISEARRRLCDLQTALEALTEPPADRYEIEMPISLTVMARYAELEVLLAEKKEAEALRLVEDLFSRFPKQLSTPHFAQLKNEMDAHYGFLLSNAERWAEAKAILKHSTPPEHWKGIVSNFLGHCHYQLREYSEAKAKLVEALTLGVPEDRRAGVHYTLGLVKYHLSDLRGAKNEFELCVKTATSEYLGTTKIWEWLEETARACGEYEEADHYRKRRDPPPFKVN